MHSSISNGTLMMSTGVNFGGNSSPSNWEPIARARQQLAQKLWFDPNIMERAKPYLPTFTFAEPATDAEIALFARAIPDSINKGVFDDDGNRRSPTYDHHVDDNMYADITEFLPRAAAASIIALYEIVGYPDGRIPDPISWDKFESVHGHLRRVVGWEFNSRDLKFSLPADKRKTITDTLATWLNRPQCTLLEAAELHGILTDASRASRSGRASFFSFQNAMRRAIQQRFHQVKGYYQRTHRRRHFASLLPESLHNRLDSLTSREMAALLWKSNTPISLSEAVQFELRQLHSHLADTNRPWSISIAHVIPRDAQFTSLGDACGTGGGAFCNELEYWFDIVWAPTTRSAFLAGNIHINLLEFIVVIIQLAACITRAEQHGNPFQMQQLAKVLIRTDNSPTRNWAHKASAKSERGQLLVSLYTALLDRTTMTIACDHIAGVDNSLADFLSRPPPLDSHPYSARCEQIYRQEPKLKSYNYFRPTEEFLSLLASRLSTKQWQASPPLPKLLGRFETVDCTISCSVTV